MQLANLQERLGEALGNKYQVLYHLGGGGMSQVYLARHRFHGGLAAVKVLAEHLAQDPNIVGRFQREARMTASLGNHPNIVPVFDIGDGNGLHFLVMQFIPGEDLCHYLQREGKIPLSQAGNVIAQVAEALSCAESKRIVHRDLKPGNMLLDNNGSIRLLDFGISRITDYSDGLTRPGESMGTPWYMSPEQIRGETCDIRSDLYSLGIVFFEILTGRRPFDNQTAIGIQMAHLSTPPPSVLEYAPELPTECDTIVQKLIAKRPEDRYQNSAELLAVLTARGANSHAGELRPAVDARLAEIVARIEEMPLDGSQTPTGQAAYSDSATQAVSPVTYTGSAVTVAPQASALQESTTDLPMSSLPMSAVAQSTAQPNTNAHTNNEALTPSVALQPTSKLPLVLGIAAVVLLMLAGGAYWLLRPKPTTGTQTVAGNQAATLPPVYSDAHGRMVLVPEGAFQFKDGQEPAQTVSLPAFYIDETEVSRGEYHRFCDATGHRPPIGFDYLAHPDYPVSNVSYEDAEAYATWAGRRLPTEQEWEKAARGTDGRTYPWGNSPWKDNVPNTMEPVTSEPLRKSPYGAYNMAGNVWEWTATSYSPSPTEVAVLKRLFKDQSFSSDWRRTKGGSFGPNSADGFDVTTHRGLPSDVRAFVWVGFRCVRNAS